jgi:16S rRNA (guanine966-N2)-methyltransferase
LRVIAGRLRGRPLRAPAGTATRPTSDRVRESLFALLGDLSGANVLDLYAGSGALAIEALSRGARRATLVECSGAAVDCIRANLARLGLVEQATVLRLRVERARGPIVREAPFDLVLCDPPWPRIDEALQAVGRLVGPELLGFAATVVIEHPARTPVTELPEASLVLQDRRVWGDTAAAFFEASRESAGPRRGGCPDGERGV